MDITVLGAAGKTGTEIVSQALAAGHRVTAFVRTPGQITSKDPGVTVVGGDARVTADLAKALVGADAVISALGSRKAGDELLEKSSQSLLSAATGAGVSRVVVLSSFLAATTYKPNMVGKLMAGMVKGIVADKLAGEALLTRSDLDWTIVYAAPLDKAKPDSPVRILGVDEPVSMSNGIARAAVARFLLAEVADGGHPRSKVVITSK